jgi:hypothetical protein
LLNVCLSALPKEYFVESPLIPVVYAEQTVVCRFKFPVSIRYRNFGKTLTKFNSYEEDEFP